MNAPNPSGLCMCGCGNPAPIARQSNTRDGWVRGQSLMYISGHQHRNPDGRAKHTEGYATVRTAHTHPHADSRGRVMEHVLIASAALGKPLPDGAEVHHVNGNRLDNRPENLVICQDHAYHMLLHRRQRALDATGHADHRRCWVCGQWGPAADVPAYTRRNGYVAAAAHAACRNKRNAHYKAARKARTAHV